MTIAAMAIQNHVRLWRNPFIPVRGVEYSKETVQTISRIFLGGIESVEAEGSDGGQE